MPLMKGIKFACEPCIRGHRSSKCNHSDRVLVQVRKPGRPLSSCPHTLSPSSTGTFVHSVPASASRETETNENDACGGISCSCDVTSVAIPKIASCACGTLKHHESPLRPPSLSITPSPAQSPTVTSRSEMMTLPISPTSPTVVSASSLINSFSNRISKPPRPKKRNAIAGNTGDGLGRRTSVIGEEAVLETLLGKGREASASVESVKTERTGNCGATGIPNKDGHVNGRLDGHAVHEFVPVPSASVENGAGQFHSEQQQFSQLQGGGVVEANLKPTPITNGDLGHKLDMHTDDMLAMENWVMGENESPSWAQPQTPKKKGCCVNKSPQRHQHMRQAHSTPQTHPCCTGGCNIGSMKPSPPMQQRRMPIPLAPYGNQFYPPPQYPQPPYVVATNFQQPASVWPYHVSTINHPLTPQELAWLQQHRAAGVFGQPPPCSVAIPPVANGAQVDSWAHSCNCGPGCNCLGCATHPFNQRTVEYVKGIHEFMESDYHLRSPHNSSHSRPFSQQLSQTQLQHNEFGSKTSISSPTHPPDPTTTTADVLSSSAASPVLEASPPCRNDLSHKQEEHITHQLSPSPSQEDDTGAGGTPGGTDNGGELSPSNFFYVDYPFGTCAQIEAGCKCGEGCTCIGCLTHGGHDGVILEGNVDENGQWGW